MTDLVPPGAFPEAEKVEQQIAESVLSRGFEAFTSRAQSLAAMRNAINEKVPALETRVAELERIVKKVPALETRVAELERIVKERRF
jgi:hypothetical protein